jgi:hypothetical protein
MALKLPDDPFGPRYLGFGPSNMSDEEAKARFKDWCKAGGAMGNYYRLFPLEAPPGWSDEKPTSEPKPKRSRGRGGR